ncbi:glycosyltransferase [Mucilaginibacter limnophilus]|uniref:Glycosyltransferase n=1 Tax=Mucilaginibacter limnophilus TaxID=1932778 RepID=A0A437MVZ7_9SPHI|nr:glycosyltransferase family 2 protein [Mucilaginibacter limnophilus]RVU01807.1 glycosyltransferase [Mucilaginibacter limnophilus]
MKVTVIIVTYNAAATLQQCLNSIYEQVFPVDIVVVDGASNDGTVGILQNNAHKLAYWVSEKDTGIYNAMNKAIKHIYNDWVYFLGADDELLPEFSAFATELKDPSAIYYANVISNGVVRSGKISDYYMAKGGIYHQSIIYPASIFKKYSFNEKYRISADYALNMRLYRDKQYHFEYKPYIIAKYNHLGISGTAIDGPFEKDKTKLIRENFGLKVWLRYAFRLLKAKLGVNKKG